MQEPRPNEPPPLSPPDATFAPTLDHRPDSTISGDFELLDEVARGGMGVVYRAKQRSLERIVALKLILADGDASEEELARFRVEAQAAARLDHPYIVPVYGFGQLDGRPYISMGFVDGPSLSVRLAREGALAPREAAALIQKVAQAMHYAHEHGVIHRDMKPGNVLIDEDGEPRVTDFGLAKRQDAEHSLTATGQVLGTPAYMPPEQAAGEDVGVRGDVYSLGATLYAALTGRPPFDAASLPELLMKVAEDPAIPPHELNRNIPPSLSAICLRALEKSPADRYASAQEMADDLSRFLGSKRVGAANQGARRLWLAAGTVTVIAVLGVAAWAWYGRGRQDNPSLSANPASSAANTSTSDRGPSVETKEDRLIRALGAAWDTLFPSPTDDIWQYRYADGAAACEQAFREFGFVLDQGDSADLADSVKGQSPEFREAILCGLELWEICAAAAKQTNLLERLRHAEDALETLDWRRSLRLARADADVAVLQQAIKAAMSQSPTPEQSELLALLVSSQPTATQPDSIAILMELGKQTPDGHLVHLALASIYQALGKAQPNTKVANAGNAVRPLRAAIKSRPKSALPHKQLAAALKDLGNPDAAKVEEELANEFLYPQAWPLVVAGRKAREEKQYSQAASLLRQALALSADMPTAEVELAATLILDGRENEAEAVLKSIGENAKDDGAAFSNMGQIARLTGPPLTIDPTRPLREFNSANDQTAVAWHLLRKYRPNLRAGALAEWGFRWADRKMESRLESLLAALELEPNNLGIRDDVCEALFALNNDPVALRYHALELMGQSTPKSEERRYAHFYLGWANGQLGDHDRAFEEFQAMWEGWPSELDCHLEARLCEYMVTHVQLQRGIPLLERFSATARNPVIWSELALLYMAAGQDERARRCLCQKLLHSNDLHYSVANTLCSIGSLRTAEALAIRMAESRPQQWESYLPLQQVLSLNGEFAGAIQAGETGRKLLNEGWQNTDRSFSLARYMIMHAEANWARTLLSAEEYIRAKEVLRDLYEFCNSDVGTHSPVGHTRGYPSDYARTLIYLDRLDDADTVCETILKAMPEDGGVRWASGVRFLARGQVEKAVEELRRARRLDPLNGLISADLGIALLRSQEWEAALVELQRGIDKYRRREIRHFRPVAFEVAVEVLQATTTASRSSVPLPVELRDRMEAQAVNWLLDELRIWKAKVKGTVPLDHSAAAQVLERVLAGNAAKRALNPELLDGLSAERRQLWRKSWDYAAALQAEAANLRGKIQSDPVRATYPVEREREVAEWVLKSGGTFQFRQASTGELSIRYPGQSWPSEPFRITCVALSNAPVEDADLDNLAGLLILTELHLDGTKVTDAGVRKLVEFAPRLDKLNVERTAVGDAGLALVTHLSEVYARRTAVSAGAVSNATEAHPGLTIVHESLLPSVPTEPGARQYALRFDGVKSFVELPIPYETGKPITIEASIVNEPVLQHPYARVVSAEAHEPRQGIIAFLFVGRTLHAAIAVSGDFRWTPRDYALPGNPLPLLQRTKLAISYDGTTLRAFQNGKLLGADRIDRVQVGVIIPRTILGQNHANGEGFQGIIDEVRISSNCRYTQDYKPVDRLEPDEQTLGLYHLDEGEGEIARDSSGNGRDGKVVNAQWIREEDIIK